jgi:hypothetical protein
MLNEGTEFQVLDCDGTDGEASFQLPPPDLDENDMTVYSVYARALGQPGGTAWLGTCTMVEEDGVEVEVCSLVTLDLEAHGNNNKFDNVTKELLFIFADLDGDTKVERYPIFDDELEGYFWRYDNNGLKLLQLRFYPGDQTLIPGSLTSSP